MGAHQKLVTPPPTFLLPPSAPNLTLITHAPLPTPTPLGTHPYPPPHTRAQADWTRALETSNTLYVGNLSFYTREEQIYEVFLKCGHMERVIMGLDKNTKTPCGFCFIIYYTR